MKKKSHAETLYVTWWITHHHNNPTQRLPKIWTEYGEYRVNCIQSIDMPAKMIFQPLLFTAKKVLLSFNCYDWLNGTFYFYFFSLPQLLALIMLKWFNPQHLQISCWNSWVRSVKKLPSKASWLNWECCMKVGIYMSTCRINTTNTGPTNTTAGVLH